MPLVNDFHYDLGKQFSKNYSHFQRVQKIKAFFEFLEMVLINFRTRKRLAEIAVSIINHRTSADCWG